MTLADLDAHRLLAGYAAREFTPVEVLADVQDRITRAEPELHAFYVREPELATAQAEASTARWASGEPTGALDGVPVTMKENIATRGTPTPAGTAAQADAPPREADGPVAAFATAAGAVRLGKTTMPDFGMLSSGRSSLHTTAARNPWDRTLTPGGSSAGAGTAAAAGCGPLHAGSDIGGSIRLPAGWTGLASLKPTWSIVPVDPPYLGRVIGPMARTIDDVALGMQVFAQSDPGHRDPTQTPSVQDWASVWTAPLEDAEIAGLRIGVHTDAGAGLATDVEIARTVEAAADVFAAAGARVERIEPFCTPDLLHLVDLFLRIRSWGDIRKLDRNRRAAVLPYIREWALGGADLSAVEALDAYHGVDRLRAATMRSTADLDVVLSPIAPTMPAPAEAHSPTDDPDTALDHIAYTLPYNVSEQPAATVNAGFSAAGLPIGLQLAGRRFHDARLLRVARWFESARPASAVPPWPWG